MMLLTRCGSLQIFSQRTDVMRRRRRVFLKLVNTVTRVLLEVQNSTASGVSELATM